MGSSLSKKSFSFIPISFYPVDPPPRIHVISSELQHRERQIPPLLKPLLQSKSVLYSDFSTSAHEWLLPFPVGKTLLILDFAGKQRTSAVTDCFRELCSEPGLGEKQVVCVNYDRGKFAHALATVASSLGVHRIYLVPEEQGYEGLINPDNFDWLADPSSPFRSGLFVASRENGFRIENKR